MSCLCTISDIRSGNACAECMNPPSVPFTGRAIAVNLTDIARDDLPEQLARQSVGKLDAAVCNELESHMTETPLEKPIATVCDTSDLTDAEVREELEGFGVVIREAQERFAANVDDLMRARAVRLALAALKANPPHPDSPLPWGCNPAIDAICDTGGNGSAVAFVILRQDESHIAAAVNAAPILAAEVERLTAQLEAARVAVGKWRFRECCACCNDAGNENAQCYADAVENDANRDEARRAVGLEG